MKVTTVVCWLCFTATAWGAALQTRIKDITSVEGVRTNSLFGVGLVTGLNGTGGSNPESRQFVLNMLQRFGLRQDGTLRLLARLDTQQRTDNVSAVYLHADLPPFSAEGLPIEVTVSAFDDAESLNGGVLSVSPLWGVDQKVYALAKGPVVVGGLSAAGDAATLVQNVPTVGKSVATIQEAVPFTLGECGYVRLLVRNADFETARRIAMTINGVFPETAHSKGAGIVHVNIPEPYLEQVPDFVARIGVLRVAPDFVGRVAINVRTGTVVAGQHVRVSAVMITHGNLTVQSAETPEVSQPEPFSERGRTVVVPRTELNVIEERRPIEVFSDTTTVGDLARALNALGATPRDLASIFQQLNNAGALHGELQFQ